MIDLHGQLAWDEAVAQQAAIDAKGGLEESTKLTDEERAAIFAERVDAAAPIGSGIATLVVLFALVLTTARGVAPSADPRRLYVGLAGGALMFLVDLLLITPTTSAGVTVILMVIPFTIMGYGMTYAGGLLSKNELLRVVFPPLVLIVAVLGSILGGITNPTPAAALGAGGALLLAAYRRLADEEKSGKLIIWASFSIIVIILIGINFDLRINRKRPV